MSIDRLLVLLFSFIWGIALLLTLDYLITRYLYPNLGRLNYLRTDVIEQSRRCMVMSLVGAGYSTLIFLPIILFASK